MKKKEVLLILLIVILAIIAFFFYRYFSAREILMAPSVLTTRTVNSLGGGVYEVTVSVKPSIDASVVLQDSITNGNILQNNYGFVKYQTL